MNYFFIDEDNFRDSFKLARLLDNFFGIIATAAVIGVILNAIRGERSSYAGALKMGLSYWGKMWWMRFIQGLVLILPLLLLIIPIFLFLHDHIAISLVLGIVMILPAVYFLIRWSLAEVVVVSEGLTGMKALSRSQELTAGRFWQVCCLGLIPALLCLVPGLVFVLLSTYVESLDRWWVDAAFAWVSDLIIALGTVVFLCAYRVACQTPLRVEAPALPPTTPEQW